jgi:TPR repeat protein
MSSDGAVEEAADEVCANCGKAEVDDVNLKKCACNLVKYCGVDCLKNHFPQHEEDCKKKMEEIFLRARRECKKRAAEIRDDPLFTQPDGCCYGECPLCCLPLPLDVARETLLNTCCCKMICMGCDYATKNRETEQGLVQKCAYCREPLPDTPEEGHHRLVERAKSNDPDALCQLGVRFDMEGDHDKAFEYYTKAAALGNAIAHYNLSLVYHQGRGVEKDEKKKIYHLEIAAIDGHINARYELGILEIRNGRFDIAAKHFTIAANLGYDKALEALKMCLQLDFASEEDYAAALRGHRAAVDATKSKQREEAEEARQEELRKKRLAEIRDDRLFTQPDESYLGECPICCLPNPLDEQKSGVCPSCCKRICKGCSYTNQKREVEQGHRGQPKCLFCREPLPSSMKVSKKKMMKRVEANDTQAMVDVGTIMFHNGDYRKAFEYWTKAAELGDVLAHFELAMLYRKGEGVERDFAKEVYHLEEAAIGGHHIARNNLGNYERMSGNMERAVKHCTIAAKLGYDHPMFSTLDVVKQGFLAGIVSKEEYAATLRGHQAAVDATKSQQRDEAYAFFNITKKDEFLRDVPLALRMFFR